MKKLASTAPVTSVMAALIGTTLFATPPVKQWDKRFGGSANDELYDGCQTSDGGYVLAGSSFSANDGDKTESSWGDFDYWILKLDSAGSKQWDKRFGGTGVDNAYSIRQTSDGGYVVAGSSASGANGDKTEASRGGTDYWIVKLDSSGNKQWDKRFGGADEDFARSIQQTSDGGYVVAGYSASNAGGDKTENAWVPGVNDYWIVKLNSAGGKQWDMRFGGTSDDSAMAIQQTSDAGYVIAGFSMSGSDGDKTEVSRGIADFWIFKLDKFCVKEWDKRFGGTGWDVPISIRQTSDGGYIAAGYTTSDAGGDVTEATRGGLDYWMVKLSGAGQKQWDKRFGGSDEDVGSSVLQASDGGYVVAGYSQSTIHGGGDITEDCRGGKDYWLVKTDDSGNKQWDKRFGGGDHEQALAIRQTSDNGFAVFGYSFSGADGDKTQATRGGSDYWMVKTVGPPVITTDPQPATATAWTATSFTVGANGTAPLYYQWQKNSTNIAAATSAVYGISSVVANDAGDYRCVVSNAGGSVTSALARLTVNKANQTIQFASIPDQNRRSVVRLAATASSGLPVAFAVSAGPGAISGGTNLSFTSTGTVSVAASQAGDANWNAAPTVTRSFRVYRVGAPAPNDYTADGISDLAVFDQNTGKWYVIGMDGTVIEWDFAWGWPGAWPVPGDYDGDGVADLAVFDQNTGWWYVIKLDGTVLAWAFQWGWPGARPVPGDYDGDGLSDCAVFDQNSGGWYVSRLDGTVLAWAFAWGWPGAWPVPGDYDGDGVADLAVFDQNSGGWYVSRLDGTVLAWAFAWGWPGAWPVSGDYDGDGISDCAVFDQNTGWWYVIALNGANPIAWAFQWGWPGAWPVSGDYDGDGISDCAVFDQNSGWWYIIRLDGTVLTWAFQWGWPGAWPVGAF